jgi:DNA-binding MarR family transcriptional regulator
MLAMLNNGKPVRPSEAAKKLDVTVAAITHRINSLEKEGYIVRTSSPTDRRVVFISLSEKGTETVSILKENHRQSIYGLVEHLGDEDSADFIDLLGKISNYYKQMENAEALNGNILGGRAGVCEGKCRHVVTGTCSHMEKPSNDQAN